MNAKSLQDAEQANQGEDGADDEVIRAGQLAAVEPVAAQDDAKHACHQEPDRIALENRGGLSICREGTSEKRDPSVDNTKEDKPVPVVGIAMLHEIPLSE